LIREIFFVGDLSISALVFLNSFSRHRVPWMLDFCLILECIYNTIKTIHFGFAKSKKKD